MSEYHLRTPLTQEELLKLAAGDVVFLSGTVFTARDKAHALMRRSGCPVSLEGAALYHCGPLISDGRVLSAGPNTSGRLARYTDEILGMGVRIIIGKGGLPGEPFRDRAVYLAYPGGCGAAAAPHWGYGFPIGGLAAMDPDTGVISPGGIGFDINCGMRVLRTTLSEDDVRPRLPELMRALFAAVPAGVGAKGFVHLSEASFTRVMVEGARWCVSQGYGWAEDLAHIEGQGCLPGADPGAVSRRAISRGLAQLGTLGSGNHYLEIQVIPPDGIHDRATARVLGLEAPGQILVMLHCGSRGFGHRSAPTISGHSTR